MKKKLLFLTTIMLWTLLPAIPVYAASSAAFSQALLTEVHPKVDVTEWYFKAINGKVYKRLYNLTQQKWIGNWIPV